MLAALWRCEFTGGFTNRLGAGLRGGVRGGEQSSSCSALSRSSAMLSNTGRPPLPVDPTLSMGQAYDALLSLSSHEVPGMIVSRVTENTEFMKLLLLNLENITWNYIFWTIPPTLYLEIIFHIFNFETRLRKLYMSIHINKCLSVLRNHQWMIPYRKNILSTFLILAIIKRNFTYSWSNCLPKRWRTPRRIFFSRGCQVLRWSSPSRALPHTCSSRCGIVPEGFRYRASRRAPSFPWNARAATAAWPSGTVGPLVRRRGAPPGPTRTPDPEAGNISTCLRGTRACPLTGNRILEGGASRILRVREVRSHSPPRQGRSLCQDVSGTSNLFFHYFSL